MPSAMGRRGGRMSERRDKDGNLIARWTDFANIDLESERGRGLGKILEQIRNSPAKTIDVGGCDDCPLKSSRYDENECNMGCQIGEWPDYEPPEDCPLRSGTVGVRLATRSER